MEHRSAIMPPENTVSAFHRDIAESAERLARTYPENAFLVAGVPAAAPRLMIMGGSGSPDEYTAMIAGSTMDALRHLPENDEEAVADFIRASTLTLIEHARAHNQESAVLKGIREALNGKDT